MKHRDLESFQSGGSILARVVGARGNSHTCAGPVQWGEEHALSEGSVALPDQALESRDCPGGRFLESS